MTSESDYRALHQSAVVVEHLGRSLGVFHGPKAAEVINGLVTNEIAALAPGEGAYAAALTPKGKILADLRVLRREDDVFVDVTGAASAGWWGMVRKYVNPRLSRFEDLSSTTQSMGLFGPAAATIVEAAGGEHPGNLSMYAHRAVRIGGVPVSIVRVPDAGVEGYVLYSETRACANVIATLTAAGATTGGESTLDIARVEAGRPAWGVDMDESTLIQEARMDELDAVSYTKGCYTGQETVARVHFRGHVNRLLRGLLSPAGVVVPRGATLVRSDGTPAGEVRSFTTSPRLGAIGLGLVRREVEPPSPLVAQWDDGTRSAEVRVIRLPFDAEAPSSTP